MVSLYVVFVCIKFQIKISLCGCVWSALFLFLRGRGLVVPSAAAVSLRLAFLGFLPVGWVVFVAFLRSAFVPLAFEAVGVLSRPRF